MALDDTDLSAFWGEPFCFIYVLISIFINSGIADVGVNVNTQINS